MLRLFINNKEVEFTQQPDILFNYKAEDTNNPTVVKTMFSKTVYIPKTANNNKIFGHINILDRIQTPDNFSPSAKYEFYLLNNSDIIESGYVKLDKITNENYECTLFGGLGSFFYTLMYKDDGEKKKLSDIQWNTFFNRSTQPHSDDEFAITLNARSVYNAFNHIPINDYNKDWDVETKESVGCNIWDWINFVPSYNGYYEDFDNDKAIIYMGSDKGIFADYQTKTEGDETYTVYTGANGSFARADLSAELTEWEVRDLRAHKQRPCVRLRRLIEACTYPENNGGYTVVLDPEFFNSENPYYNQAYIALPLFSSLVEGKGDISIESGLISNNNVLTTNSIVNANITPTNYLSDYKWSMVGNTFTPYYLDSDNTLNRIPYNASFNIQYRFNLKNGFGSDNTYFGTTKFSGKIISSSIAIQLIACSNLTNEVLSYSPIYNFTDGTYKMLYEDWKYGDKSQFVGDSINNIYGYFKNGTFVQTNVGDNSLFELKLENIPILENGVYIKCVISKGCKRSELINGNVFLVKKPGWNSLDELLINTSYVGVYDVDSFENCVFGSMSSLNYVNLTKKDIFTQEISPAEYLIDYCKIFGLKFICDNLNKKVQILTKNNYYKNEIINLEDCIDYGGEIDLTPLTFNARFFNMQLETPETALQEKYNKKYEVEYGMKKINTNYNFSSDETELFDSNIYKNGITLLDHSNAYYNWTNNGSPTPTINVNHYEYVLFNGNPVDLGETTINMYPYSPGERTTKISLGTNSSDAFPKMCYFNEDMGLSDFGNNLLFRSDNRVITDGDGNTVCYTITNDIEEMYILNGGNPCWLIPSSIGVDKTFMITTDNLPVYNKYITETTFIDGQLVETPVAIHSLDFGSPREVYCDLTVEDDVSIYNRFWKKFIEDQYSIDSRKISCDVLFKTTITEDALRKFYLFGNALWVLNEVSDYNPAAKTTTTCEFIKVIDLENYTNGQIKLCPEVYFKGFGDLYNMLFDKTNIIYTQSSDEFTVEINESDSAIRQDIEYYTTINGISLSQQSSVTIKKDGDIKIKFDRELINLGINTINLLITIGDNEFNITCKITDGFVIKDAEGLVVNDEYNLTISEGETVSLYLTSVNDVNWVDLYGTLQDLYINNVNGSGVISSGVDIPIQFALERGEVLEGTVKIYNDTQALYINITTTN